MSDEAAFLAALAAAPDDAPRLVFADRLEGAATRAGSGAGFGSGSLHGRTV
jgi:uncharacterized protein (TIGR02996 family)